MTNPIKAYGNYRNKLIRTDCTIITSRAHGLFRHTQAINVRYQFSPGSIYQRVIQRVLYKGCKGGWNHNKWKSFLGSRDKRVISYANTSLWRNNILPYRKSRVWVCEQFQIYLYCMEEYTDDDLQRLVIIYFTRYKPYARIERVQRLQSYMQIQDEIHPCRKQNIATRF